MEQPYFFQYCSLGFLQGLGSKYLKYLCHTVELVSKELHHLVAILQDYDGSLIFMK